MKNFCRLAAFVYLFLTLAPYQAEGKLLAAYISDSPSSSVPEWIAKETGLFKKYGLDIDLVFIDGSTRGIQALMAGDLSFTEAVGTSAINGKLAGGNIAIVNGLVNTLPYYIVGSPAIKSPEDLKGRTAAVHIPGTAADFALRLALEASRYPLQSDQSDYGGRRTGAHHGADQRSSGIHRGQRRGKVPGRETGPKNHYRHGGIQSPVSIHLHRHHAAK